MKRFLSYQWWLLLALLAVSTTITAQERDSVAQIVDSVNEATTVVDTIVSVVDKPAPDEEELRDTAIVSIYRSISTDSLALIKKDKGFYYQTWLDSLLRAEANAEKKKPRKLPEINLDGLKVFFNLFSILLGILAVAILVFVIYKLASGNNALFLKRKKNIEAVIEAEQEVTDGNYEGLVKKAEAESNFRQAVRYLHLQALYNLGQKEYVRMATEKTNYQYQNELRTKSADLARLFAALTFKYEYIWYGEYTVTNSMYYMLKQQFNEFNKELDKR